MDGLLQQINTGEIRTQVIKWHNVCGNIHGVMREIILGVEMNAIGVEKYNRLMATLGSRLCSLPVCIVSWLSSYSHYSHSQVCIMWFLRAKFKFRITYHRGYTINILTGSYGRS